MTETQRDYITHEQPASDGYRIVMHERDAVLVTPDGERIEANDASAMAWLADVLNDYDAVVTAACEAASRIEAYLCTRQIGLDQIGELTSAIAAIDATGIRRTVGPVAILTEAQTNKLRKALTFGDSAAGRDASPSPATAASCGEEADGQPDASSILCAHQREVA